MGAQCCHERPAGRPSDEISRPQVTQPTRHPPPPGHDRQAPQGRKGSLRQAQILTCGLHRPVTTYPLAALAEIAGCFAMGLVAGRGERVLAPARRGEPCTLRLAACTGRDCRRRTRLCDLRWGLHRRLDALDVDRRGTATGQVGSGRNRRLPHRCCGHSCGTARRVM
jgi:hypothetical protein